MTRLVCIFWFHHWPVWSEPFMGATFRLWSDGRRERVEYLMQKRTCLGCGKYQQRIV